MIMRYFTILSVIIILSASGCSNRFIRISGKGQIRELNLISCTSNSWFGWGQPVPGMDHLLFDTLSACVYAVREKKLTVHQAIEEYKNGRSASGYDCSVFSAEELGRSLAGSGISYKMLTTGKGNVLPSTESAAAFSFDALKLVAPSLPESSRETISRVLPYIESGNPGASSAAEDMPKILLSQNSNDEVRTVLSKTEKKTESRFIVMNITCNKQGMTIQGSGFGEIRCVIKAVVFDADGDAVWASSAEGTGESFTSVMYFPVSWNSLKLSARGACSAAVKKLAEQIREDFR